MILPLEGFNFPTDREKTISHRQILTKGRIKKKLQFFDQGKEESNPGQLNITAQN